MTAEPAESDTLIELYALFRAEVARLPFEGRIMPYSWYNLPASLPIYWLPYREMLREMADELANSINALTTAVHRLRAWGTLMPTLPRDQQLEVKLEFTDTLCIAALGMPYAIKSRFTYSAACLCHQANRAVDPNWTDEFIDEENLYLNDIEPFCRGWRRFRRFKTTLERVAGSTFKDGSGDYRNSYNHRLPPQLALGLSGLARRHEADGAPVSYSFGATGPLEIASMAALLAVERDRCALAFDRFQDVVNEHTAAITSSLPPA